MTRGVLLLAPVLALVLLPSNVVATALPILRGEWGVTNTEMGWVFAAYQAGYVSAVLVLLPLTDRFAVGRVILGCALGSTVVSVAFPLLARDVWSAALLRAFAGAGLAGVYLPGVRLVAGTASAERRGLAVGLYVSAFYLGSSLSLWAAGVLLGFGDWRFAALALGATAAAAIPLSYAALSIPATQAGGRAVLKLSVLRHEPILRTILAYAGHSWELYVSRGWLAAFLATVLTGYGLGTVESAAEGGKWAALMVGLGTLGVWLGGWLSDRWGRSRAALGFALASGLISLGFGWLGAGGWAVLLVVGCLYGVLMAGDSAIYSTAVTELALPGALGSAQAAQAFIGFLASTISPVAAGKVLDLGGGFEGVFLVGGVASLLGALVLVPLAARPAAERRSPLTAD